MLPSGSAELPGFTAFLLWLNIGEARPLGRVYNLRAAPRLWCRGPVGPGAVVAGGGAAFRSLHPWPWLGPPTPGHLPASKMIHVSGELGLGLDGL